MTSDIIILTSSKNKIAMVPFFFFFPDAHFWQASLVAIHDCMHARAGGHAELHIDNLKMKERSSEKTVSPFLFYIHCI